MKIRINKIDNLGSVVDGPGLRTVLYLQGCDLKCKGCHNPETWDQSKGELVDVQLLAEHIKNTTHNKKLTITGGEPLIQTNEVLCFLSLLEGFDIALYTGYELDKVDDRIMHYLTYIKTGAYEADRRTTVIPYVGSSNQRFLKVSGGFYDDK